MWHRATYQNPTARSPSAPMSAQSLSVTMSAWRWWLPRRHLGFIFRESGSGVEAATSVYELVQCGYSYLSEY